MTINTPYKLPSAPKERIRAKLKLALGYALPCLLGALIGFTVVFAGLTVGA